MKHLIFNIAQLSVEFKNDSLICLHEKAQKLPDDPERGGIILGRLFPENSKIIVTDIIESKQGQSQRMGFKMNINEVQEIMHKIWEESGGKVTYLGDWHTHPENNPSPSLIDHATFRMNYFGSKIDQNLLLYIIVGTNNILNRGIWLAACNGYNLYQIKNSIGNIRYFHENVVVNSI